MEIAPKRYRLRDPDPSGWSEVKIQLVRKEYQEEIANAPKLVQIEVDDVERGDKCDPEWLRSFKYADDTLGKWIYIDFHNGHVWFRKYTKKWLHEGELDGMIRDGYLVPTELVDGPQQDLRQRTAPVIWKWRD